MHAMAVQDEIAAVTSALPAPAPGVEVDEFEARLQHALEALTMEVPPAAAHNSANVQTKHGAARFISLAAKDACQRCLQRFTA